MNVRSLFAILGTALILVLGFTGCGSSDEEGTAGPTSSQSSSAGEGETPDAPVAPPEPTPTVEAADGIKIKLPKVSMRVPKGWLEGRIPSNFGALAYPKGSLEMDVFLSSFTDPGEGEWFTPFEMHAENVAEGFMWRPGGPRRLDDVEVDGVKMFHLVGRRKVEKDAEHFGTVHADQQIGVLFTFKKSVPVAERDAVISSIMASIDFEE